MAAMVPAILTDGLTASPKFMQCIELGNPAASFLRGARMFSYILVIAY